MHKRLSFLLALALLMSLTLGIGAPALAATDYSNVRVRLSVGSVNSMTIPVSGTYFIQENGVTFKNGTLTAEVSGGQIVLSHSSGGELYSGSSVNIMRQSIEPSAGYLRIATSHGTRSYLGHLNLRRTSSGYIQAVNTVPLAHYLYGVVAYEMNDNFPLEALKAQAVAAKCYVLANMNPSSYYDIGDTASDQVYKGYVSSYKNVIKAVDATWNVGLYLGSSILCSYFAASNGGSTLLPSDAWSGSNRYQWDKAFKRVEDPYDVKNPLSVQETIFFPEDGDDGDMSTALGNYLRNRAAMALANEGVSCTVLSIDAINELEIVQMDYSDSDNIVAYIDMDVLIRDADGDKSEENVAYNFYINELKWNGVTTKTQSLRLYTVEESRKGFEVYRGRYGHGVGLSQRGAEQMANDGWDYEEILEFYYPGAKLKDMKLSKPTDPVNNNAGSSSAGSSNADSNTQPPASGDITATAVTKSSVNFRTGPGTNYTKLGSVPGGTNLNVYGESNGWSLVAYQGTQGYIRNDYLTITPVSSGSNNSSGNQGGSGSSDGYAVAAYGEVTSNTLNFRDKAVTGKVLQQLKKGDQIDIYAYVEDSTWYYCAAKGMEGYVSAQYIKLTGTPSNSSSGSGSQSNTQPSVSSGMAAAGSIGVINNETAYWHKNPAFVAKDVMGRFPNGTTLTLEGYSGEFYIVTVNGITGYVYQDDLTITSYAGEAAGSSPSNTAGASQSVMGYGQTTANVNFRKGPGTNYDSIGKLAKGTKLTLYAKESNGWYHVQADGKEGYVSGAYVKVTQQGSTSSSSQPGSAASSGSSATLKTGQVVNEWVRLRSSASYSTQDNIIGDYDVGTQLTILGASGSWYQVQTPDGKTGYMHSDYVKITGTISTRAGKTTARVNFRKQASESAGIIQTLAKGTAVTILGESGEWYQIQVGSNIGYAVKRYISG